MRARVRLKARTEANVFICISSDAVTLQGSQNKTSLCWLCCATQCRVRRGLLPQVRTNEAEIEGWDFVSASPQGSLNPIESVVLRLTPPIWTLLSLRGTASTQARRPFWSRSERPFRHLIRLPTCDPAPGSLKATSRHLRVMSSPTNKRSVAGASCVGA